MKYPALTLLLLFIFSPPVFANPDFLENPANEKLYQTIQKMTGKTNFDQNRMSVINTCLGRGDSVDDCIAGLIASSARQSSVQEANDSATTSVPPVNVLLGAIIILACTGIGVILMSAKRRARREKR
jgi:hypothetical protein